MKQSPRVLVTAALLILAVAPLAAEDRPLQACFLSGSDEYESDRTLADFARHLEARYHARAVLLKARGTAELPGLEALESCDVALFFTRRLTIEGEPLERVKRYCESGRPIVAVRTGSHGFQKWLEFDPVVLGGNYQGHFGVGPTLEAKVSPGAESHPLLRGVGLLRSRSSLYKTAPLAAGAEILLLGSTPASGGPQPLAWSRDHQGGRVFYTSLGAQGDFENSSFRRLLANALFWAARREVEAKELPPIPPPLPRREGSLTLHLRSRLEPWKGSGVFEEVTVEKKLPAAETAILICDMWDQHWCQGATARCEKLAERMAPVVDAARARGVQVIHCPSETLGFYADSIPRRRMARAPAAAPPKALEIPDHPLPIDDSGGGCDTAEKPWYGAWTRENAQIHLDDEDGISENGGEVYNFLVERGIKNVIFMGVHTNMCVLGRSFGIKQMARWGIRCILARDLTDTMYDPRDPPRVSHEEGTELVVEHIEKYWCPTILSTDLVGGLQ
jgi:type 1 glutamine amidotransferase/nicotinamidase-related amidase